MKFFFYKNIKILFYFFVNIKRRNNILTMAVEWKIESERPRGCPCNNWVTEIEEWTGLPARKCSSQAADRSLWSVIARQLPQR